MSLKFVDESAQKSSVFSSKASNARGLDMKGTVLGGSLLVAGTSIGGGMLALPVLTSLAGFLPSITVYIFCWLFMCATGLLFLEISGWMKQEANIVSMADMTLGKKGKLFAWIVYLFLFYCLTIAYMVGSGNILVNLSNGWIPDKFGPLIFTLIFAPLILIPTFLAGRLNIILVTGLALSYLGFVFIGFRHVNYELLSHYDWNHSLKVLPIAFTSFAYQGIVPTLAAYLHHDVKKIRTSILIGSSIPLIAYIIWEWLILGIVPLDGPHGLKNTLQLGENAVYPLKFFISGGPINWLGQSFAFFALITSFLGVSLGLRDFLADGMGIRKDVKGLILLAFLVLFPPLIIAISYPHIFLIALEYAGGFGCALLLGLLPVIMAWKGRYSMKFPFQPQLPGGKILLFFLGTFVTIEIVSEIKHLITGN